MKQTFKVNVNDTFDFDITSENISELDLIKTSKDNYHLLHDNRSYQIEVSSKNFAKKSYEVKVNNNTYNIDISNQLDALIKDLGFEIGNAKQVDKITAPMPGLILEMSVNIGDSVKENDTLLILEAMKMENVISSPREGVIKSISVKQGAAVEKNQLLIEFE